MDNKTIHILLATDEMQGYAKNHTIPWKNKEDMLQFKQLTTNNTIIMGRNTWESLPIRPLPNRFNIVVSGQLVTSNETFDPINVLICKNTNTLYDFLIHDIQFNIKYPDYFVIGGKQLIEEFIQRKSEFNYNLMLHLTVISGNYYCDQHINFDFTQWDLFEQRPIEGGILYTYKNR